MSSAHEQLHSSAKAPHFFKIILDDNIQQGKLEIPRKFTRKYGQDMSDPVLLKVPSGAAWEVQLTKSTDHAGVWSLHGLHAFVEYYSVQLGHFLLFRYQGKSNFFVFICDTSALEIDYPLQEPKFDGESSERIAILDDLSPNRGIGGKTRSNEECPERDKRKFSSKNGCSEGFEGTEECGGFMAADKRRRMVNPLGASRKGRALEVASSFKSRNPFFAVTMHHTYVCSRFRLIIPGNVVTKYFLKNYGYISLRVSNGGPWSVKYIRYNTRSCTRPRVEFSLGWKVFARDNKLEAGDVCVFELIDGKELLFDVVIFRASEDEKSQHCTEGGGFIAADKRRRTVKPLAASKEARALEEASSFKSRNPFFVVSMHPSYVFSKFQLVIPVNVVTKYFLKNYGYVTLQVSNGRTWQVKYTYSSRSCNRPRVGFGKGWKEFVRDNKLEVGDVCVFELINGKESLLQVVIFRAREDAKSQHCTEGGELIAADKRRRSGKPLAASKEARALEEACSFKSRNPFFVVSMRPSYVSSKSQLSIPLNVVTKYFLKNYGYITLQVSNDRTWHVKYSRYSSRSRNRPRVEFTKGWKEFVRDNKLEVGDVCVFELINGKESLLQVVIFRACGDAKSQHSERIKVSKTEASQDDSVEVLDDSTLCVKGEKSSLPCLSPHEMVLNEPKCTRFNGLRFEKPKKNLHSSSMHGAASHSRLLTCQESIGEYRSEFPFFIKTMCWNYLHGSQLSVSRSFAKKYIKKGSASVRLQVADRSWVLQSCKYVDGSCKFIRWTAFARENSLREGDICIFELIRTNDMLFKVSIFRYASVKT